MRLSPLSSALSILILALPAAAQQQPLSEAVLRTTNAKLGLNWNVQVHCGVQTESWLLLSSLRPQAPVTLAGIPTFLASDWQVLDYRNTAGSTMHPYQIQVPAIAAAQGLELVAQSILYRANTGELGITNPALLKLQAPLPNSGKYVLLVRQTINNSEAPFSVTQADGLAASLRSRGHDVTVVDNEIPAALQGFDCILDCRFTLQPNPLEADRTKNFLATGGGVFFLAGPWAHSLGGQLRVDWLSTFLNQELSIPTVILSGLGYSNGTPQELVDPSAPPAFLSVPNLVSVQPYDVEQEGGHFGPVGYHTIGKPMITGPVANQSYVYGMMWESDDIAAFPSSGPLAILLNGAPDALGSSPTGNPNAEDVFENLVHWLDR